MRLVHRPGGARLVWVRLGNCSNATLLAIVETAWAQIMSELENGEAFVELRG